MEVGLVVDETLFADLVDQPLLQIAENKAVEVIFTRQTDMRHIDSCYRGPKPSFDEDMREAPPAASE